MDNNSNNSFRWVIGSQYFLYFGVMGIFLPYFNLYCYHIDFTGFQIGVLSAIRSVALILTPLIWGAMADRFRIRRPIFILCSFVSTTIWAFYLYTTDFWAMLIITVFYGIFYSPIISFLEAFTMDVLGTRKKSYGRVRGWGSIAFIITVIVLGKIIDLYSIEIILILIFFGSLAQALISIKIPDIQIKKQTSFSSNAKALPKRRVIVFLFCAFLMLVSHGTYYGFYSIHLENLGFGKTFIGISWALASIAEIIVMIKSDSLFKHFSIDNVLFFSFMVAVFRWLAMSFVTSAAGILFLQLFHAMTYAMFHVSSILYIDSLTPDEAKTLGQSVNNAVTYGLGLMVGFFINGYLFETLGTFKLFMISSLIALSGGLILKGSQMMDRKHV
ncbi:MAG TPA: MFS transporter [Desulfobacterales bacterium]|nr:MFS transporter [Desulfobacterales bacterium]